MGATVHAEAIELANRRALRVFVPIGGTDGDLRDMHIAMEGSWEGHPSGPFSLSAEDIDRIIARFDAQKNPMMVDYYHRSLNESGTPDDGFAAGWIQKLYRKNTAQGAELWAKVNWTPRAAAAIQNGELAYCSPVIDWQSVDRKTGDATGIELFNVGMTNQPFLDGQHPTRLTRMAGAFPPPKDKKAPPDQQAAPDKQAPPPPDKSAPDAEPDPNDPKEPAEQRAGEPPEQKHADTMPGEPAMPGMPPAEPAMQLNDPASVPDNVAPAQNVEDALVSQFVDSVAKAAGMDRVAVCALLNDYADQVGSAIGAKAKRDGTPAENRTMSDKPNETTVTPPAGDEAGKLDAIERQAEKDKLLTLSDRFAAVEAEVRQLRAARDADIKARNEAEVDKMIADGFVRPERREDALVMMSQDPARARRVFSEKVVPVGTTQAGTEQNTPKVELDAKTAKREDLEPHEQSIYDSQRQLSWSHEKAIKYVLSNRDTIRRSALKLGLVH